MAKVMNDVKICLISILMLGLSNIFVLNFLFPVSDYGAISYWLAGAFGGMVSMYWLGKCRINKRGD